MPGLRIFLPIALLLLPVGAQTPGVPGRGDSASLEDEEKDGRLQAGRSQKDELAKAAYLASLDDTKKLIAAAEELRRELEKNDRYVVSLAAIKQTEDIEKLARRIRSRLKQP